MKTKTLVKTLSLLVLLAFQASLSACDIATRATAPAVSPDLKPVYQTVEVILTRTSFASTAPSTSTPTPVSAAASGDSTQPVVSRSPAPEPLARPCDLVSPGRPIDVTIQDGERFQPGEVFSKTWRLVNAGECIWSRSYSVVFFSGQPMGAAGQQSLAIDVQPGAAVDVTVDMVAPQSPGSYQSNWKLRNENGELFGLGPNGDAPFWVQIVVVQVEAPNTAVLAPSLTPTLPVHSAGIVKLLPADSLDLDSGSLNQAGSGDVTYVDEELREPAFSPGNGARLSLYGPEEPDESACQTAFLRQETLDLSHIETGVYLCYRTSQGLPGFLHVIRPVSEEDALNLDFVTWSVP